MITITLKCIQTIKDEIETIDFFQTKMNLIVKFKDKECFSRVKEYVKKILNSTVKKSIQKMGKRVEEIFYQRGYAYRK